MKLNQILMIVVLAAAIASCSKNVNKPKDESEHEAINSVTLTFREGGSVVGVFKAEDPDGDGGNPPTRIDNITLQANKTYSMEVTLQNISGTTVKDVTENVRAQSRHHEFFFLPAGSNVTITKLDKDVNNFPVGFSSSWVTGAASNGSVRIKLMHKPFIKGPNDGPNVGHSDLDMIMPVIIN